MKTLFVTEPFHSKLKTFLVITPSKFIVYRSKMDGDAERNDYLTTYNSIKLLINTKNLINELSQEIILGTHRVFEASSQLLRYIETSIVRPP